MSLTPEQCIAERLLDYLESKLRQEKMRRIWMLYRKHFKLPDIMAGICS